MRRLIILIFVAVAALGLPLPASAGVTWCRSDPVFRFNDTLVDVQIAFDIKYREFVNGPIHYVIELPRNVQGGIWVSDPGFHGYGIDVDFVRNTRLGNTAEAFQTRISVYIPIDKQRLAQRYGRNTTVWTELTVLPVLPPGDLTLTQGTSDKTTVKRWIAYGS